MKSSEGCLRNTTQQSVKSKASHFLQQIRDKTHGTQSDQFLWVLTNTLQGSQTDNDPLSDGQSLTDKGLSAVTLQAE